MKSRAGMEALINDQQTQELDILLIQEPPLTAYQTHVQHRLWQRYQPTYADEDGSNTRKRSLVYVNSRISMSAHRQIRCNHPDVTAIKIWSEHSEMLVFSIYVQPVDYHRLYEVQSMQLILEQIEATIQEHTKTETRTTLILAGDFNRHHPAWSNSQVYERVIVHAEELINFFHAHRLQWCLAGGEPTYWSLNRPGQNSTIDLTMTNEPQKLLKCGLYHENYGSDHRGTLSEWDMRFELRPETKLRRAYERADWAKIGCQVQARTDNEIQIGTPEQLDWAVQNLTVQVQAAVDEHTPRTRPSPYSKRWFTPGLKAQQKEVNKLRRGWQESCANKGPAHSESMQLFTKMHSKRREWTRTIEKTKAAHWKEFLDQANTQTVWKTTPYLNKRDTFTNIPPLKVGDDEVTDNHEKATVLMETFFPVVQRTPPEIIVPPEEIEWEPITEAEIEKVLRAAKKNTAPGSDELPTLVWQQIWPYVAALVFRIFTASLNLGHHPQQWKAAKIVTLRKPGKSDYTSPNAYRPISLLNTLGKLLEAVMARRLSYYAEAYQLLPDTQFGGRPGRNTEQALLVLANAVDQAWLRHKVVTLIAFDLKGAFNGVNHSTLDARLREKRIPSKARQWIQSFMQDRRASIHFDGFSTEVGPVEHAGLAQGSPLSPILFAFFNADLVDQEVNTRGGASAYIDDYFRWRIGASAEENLRKLQQEDIPRITEWAQRTGSSFTAEKTELIHLTRRKRELCHGSVSMDGAVIKASPTARLLGVTFDQELRWKDHVQRAVKQATVATLGMSGLRHLRPAQMRQIYQACILPKLEYASTVWHNPLKDKMHLRLLGTVQRAALLRIISAFRTVATQTLEVECHIPPLHLRLKQRGQDVVTRLHTLPKGHPLTKVMNRLKQRVKRKGTQSSSALVQTMKTMDLEELETLETINPAPREPWGQSPFEAITIEQDKIQAIDDVAEVVESSDEVIFTDASIKDSNVGAAVVRLSQGSSYQQTVQLGVGPATHWTIHAAELIAIHQAIELIEGEVDSSATLESYNGRLFTIISDSQTAIQALAHPTSRSGQQVVHRILDQVNTLQTRAVRVRLFWVPGHAGVKGNEIADQLAKQAVSLEPRHDYRRPVSTYKRKIRETMAEGWRQEWTISQKGHHLKRIDDGLPAKRASRVYGSLTRHQTYLLVQLRTGHSWLATFAKIFRFTEDNRCECGAVETVVHVLVDCPRLREARKQLRDKVGEAFGSLASLLGGRNGQGRVSNSGRERNVIQAVLEFAETSKRFTSRAPAAESRVQDRP